MEGVLDMVLLSEGLMVEREPCKWVMMQEKKRLKLRIERRRAGRAEASPDSSAAKPRRLFVAREALQAPTVIETAASSRSGTGKPVTKIRRPARTLTASPCRPSAAWEALCSPSGRQR